MEGSTWSWKVHEGLDNNRWRWYEFLQRVGFEVSRGRCLIFNGFYAVVVSWVFCLWCWCGFSEVCLGLSLSSSIGMHMTFNSQLIALDCEEKLVLSTYWLSFHNAFTLGWSWFVSLSNFEEVLEIQPIVKDWQEIAKHEALRFVIFKAATAESKCLTEWIHPLFSQESCCYVRLFDKGIKAVEPCPASDRWWLSLRVEKMEDLRSPKIFGPQVLKSIPMPWEARSFKKVFEALCSPHAVSTQKTLQTECYEPTTLDLSTR